MATKSVAIRLIRGLVNRSRFVLAVTKGCYTEMYRMRGGYAALAGSPAVARAGWAG